jgi:molybdate transport system ATP-binding protein
VFQDARLFPHLSVLGNLRYASQRAPAVTRPTIRFDEVVTLLGLEQLLVRRTHQLSGGERQRVALGRALLSQPRLLLLDEPLASLDLARREEVLPYLERLREVFGLPMVYVTHQFDEVLRLATHMVLLDAGKVLAAGDITAISVHPELRRLLGADAMGAVVDAEVVDYDADGHLAQLRVGGSTMKIISAPITAGVAVRVQILARDVILATQEPRALSVQNAMRGAIANIVDEDAAADLVYINLGGPVILSRITKAATRSLGLNIGDRVWALVKAASLRGHSWQAKFARRRES